MTIERKHYTPTGEFEVGDVVEIHNPLDVNLEGLTAEILTGSKTVIHSDDATVSAHAVTLSGTKDVVVILGPEMRLAPENDRHRIGRRVDVTLDDGANSRGTYISGPRNAGRNVYQVVELDETGDIVIEVRDGN